MITLNNLKFKLKQISDFIIEETFSNVGQAKLNRYKNFYLKLTEKEYKSRTGCYNMHTKTVEISSVNKVYFCNLLITLLHEITHHIEFCDTKNTGHSNNFYKIHTKLIFTAIDTGLLTYEDAIKLSETSLSRNKNKLANMINNYIPNKNKKKIAEYCDISFIEEYNKLSPINEVLKVCCTQQYNKMFKERKYSWSDEEKVWYKTFYKKPDYNMEVNFLSENNFLCFRIHGISYFTNEVYFIIKGNSYKYKEQLKELGYRYYNKEWRKRVSTYTYKHEISKLRSFYGIIITYEYIKK